MIEFMSVRSLGLVSVAIYMLFDFIDGKRVKDEREELIQLKSLEFSHKATLCVLTLIAGFYMFYPWMSAFTVIVLIVLAALYTEIFAKFYYRKKL